MTDRSPPSLYESEGEFFTDDHLPADHPSLALVQKALLDRVSLKEIEASERLRAERENLKRLEKHLEDLGVTLYNRQAQLARQQSSREAFDSVHASVISESSVVEEEVRRLEGQYETISKQLGQDRISLERAISGRSDVCMRLSQLSAFHATVASDIAVNKRSSSKTEEAIRILEKEKLSQDLILDTLTEAVRRGNSENSFLAAQITAQISELEKARETIRQAAEAYGEIKDERKIISQQLAPGRSALARKDSALQAMLSDLEKIVESTTSLGLQEKAVRMEISTHQNRAEQLDNSISRISSEISSLQSQLKESADLKEKLFLEFDFVKKTCENLKNEIQQNIKRLTAAETQRLNFEREISLAQKSLSKIRLCILDLIASSSSLDRDVDDLIKQSRQASAEEERIDMEISSTENELARVRFDSLNAEAHINALSDKLKDVKNRMQISENKNSKILIDIKRKHTELEKKQSVVESLNRQFEALRLKLASADDAALAAASLSGKVRIGRKQLSNMQSEICILQRQWTARRGELLQVETTIESNSNSIDKLKTIKGVRENAMKRFLRESDRIKTSMKEIDSDIRQLRNDLDKMNMIRVRFEKLKDRHYANLENLKSQFKTRMHERAVEGEVMQKQVEDNRLNLEEISSSIVECESAAIDWLRNITIESEMQNAVDPSVGKHQEDEVKREVHRMELRLSSLRTRQAEVARDLEMTVSKRNVIEMKSGGYLPKSRKNRLITLLAKKLEIAECKKKETSGKISALSAKIEKTKYITQELQTELNSVRGMTGDMRLLITAHKIGIRRSASIEQIEPGEDDSTENTSGIVSLMTEIINEGCEKFPRFLAVWEQFRIWIEQVDSFGAK